MMENNKENRRTLNLLMWGFVLAILIIGFFAKSTVISIIVYVIAGIFAIFMILVNIFQWFTKED